MFRVVIEFYPFPRKFWLGNLDEFGDIGLDGTIVLKRIFKEQD
jgi:hypothetical protein